MINLAVQPAGNKRSESGSHMTDIFCQLLFQFRIAIQCKAIDKGGVLLRGEARKSQKIAPFSFLDQVRPQQPYQRVFIQQPVRDAAALALGWNPIFREPPLTSIYLVVEIAIDGMVI